MKTKNILLSVLLLGVLLGCSNFLDVTPRDKQTQEQLFATSSGYYAALNGLYNNLASTSLYGRNLSYETIDLMALRYKPLSSQGSLYSAAISWDYSNSYLQSMLSSVWQTAYKTILNTNVVLENLENQHDILKEEEAEIMKGELLAIRAFLHFDMLRLFGPIYKSDPKALSIPYNESVEIGNLPLLPADSVIFHKILRDLNLAEISLKEDPVITGGPMASASEDDGEIFLRYRQLRFNYYAVKALKARVLLYAGDMENANLLARELLEDENVKKHFPPVDPSKLLGNGTNPDRVFSSESLFGIYLKDRADIYTYVFDEANAGQSVLYPKENYVAGDLFAGETGDYRYQSQWENMGSNTGFVKYKKLKGIDETNPPFYATFFPLIRLSEVYYIAAESASSLEMRYAYLNDIRSLRGIPERAVVSEDDFMTWLRAEYLREFYGEGQIFFMYKRMNVNIDKSENAYNNTTYKLSKSILVPPLPEGEISYR